MGLFDKAESKTEQVTGKVQNKYGEVTGNAEHEVKGKAKEAYGQRKQAASDTLDAVQDCAHTAHKHIKKNPLTAATISAGVGFLIGYLIAKK